MISIERDPPPARHDWLDAILAADAHATQSAYIADDGFTARVIAALPAAPQRPAWRAPIVGAMWTVAAVGLAVAAPGTMLDAVRETYRFVASQPVSLTSLAGAAAALLALTGAAAVYGLRDGE